MIRLDVRKYCEACLDFEADVTKAEQIKVFVDYVDEVTIDQTDTIIRCKYAKRCEGLKRYLEQQAKGGK